jgi:hypothetical protein
VSQDSEDLEAFKQKIRAMREAELVDFIRDTVVHLNVLADRLESLVRSDEGGGFGARTGYPRNS